MACQRYNKEVGMTQFVLRAMLSLAAVWALINRDMLVDFGDMINGYGSKIACSLHFIQNRSLDDILRNELTWPPFRLCIKLREVNGTCVESSIWFAPFFRPSLACLHEQGRLGCARMSPRADPRMLETTMVDTRLDKGEDFSDFAVKTSGSGLDELMDVVEHFTNEWLKSRTFIAVNATSYPARILFEYYTPPYAPSTPQAGWSMAKSIFALFVGCLLRSQPDVFRQGLDTRIPLLNGTTATLEDMLRMQDGLDFDEQYVGVTDSTRMLFIDDDAGLLRRKRIDSGRCFQYSSKTTNILSKYIKSRFSSESAYLNAPYRLLFSPLGIKSARLETDASNIFVFSSFCFMTPRDWTRLGVLVANGGIWPPTGRRLIDEDYMKSLAAPTKTSRGTFGMHFWLGGNEYDSEPDSACDGIYPTRPMSERSWYSKLPRDSLLMSGFEGQHMVILQKEKLVMLRMGSSREGFPFGIYQPKDLFYPVIDHLLHIQK